MFTTSSSEIDSISINHFLYSSTKSKSSSVSFITILKQASSHFWGFPGGSAVKNLPANVGNAGSIPGLGRPPGEENGSPLQYSCLENPMDRGAWWAIIYRVAKRDMP